MEPSRDACDVKAIRPPPSVAPAKKFFEPPSSSVSTPIAAIRPRGLGSCVTACRRLRGSSAVCGRFGINDSQYLKMALFAPHWMTACA
eukprot:CAMPEP_0206304984 /NCGR_PEP_ID=MMETSP0106_2-20121207/10027_1 /ASSEMBLY_ACC=CAM_ASM_000206 /TAXON_ID=81532 /ORGANISM="Acanthoeca-like sp., Strain 10tr" /LENGTH=87 /DNA_ID=CAMNT_0053735813 /DNA_START=286 /DNA_END=546 /DNA_ORIENTATION=-